MNRFNQPVKSKNSQEEFAEQVGVGVGTGTVARIEYVEKHAPELLEKIVSGEMDAKKAYKKAK